MAAGEIPPLPPSLPQYCTPVTPLLVDLSIYFHTCVPTPLAFVSTLLGTLSIVAWLFAQLPQIYKNYRLQSTAGLSIFFLGEWLLGDATNLLGALLTHQASWQVVVASYYVFVDVCLVIQYFWYTKVKPKLEGGSLHSGGSSELGDGDSEIINGLSPINSNFVEDSGPEMQQDYKTTPVSRPVDSPEFTEVTYSPTSSQGIPLEKKASASWQPMPSPRTILFIATLCALVCETAAAPTASPMSTRPHRLVVSTNLEVAGTILSWCSTALYLGSRIPQLYHNWTRQSTAGLSSTLFLAAFCGNLFYSTSLLTNPNAWSSFGPYGGHGWVDAGGSDQEEWVSRAAPFFLGAAGVLGLDASMGVQFLMYRERVEEKIVRVRSRGGIGHWERVDGWMRGWVPSLQKERVVDLAESQRLLTESRELERSSRSREYDYGALARRPSHVS